MMWIYDLPNWSAGIIIVGVTTLVALGGHRLNHWLFRKKHVNHHEDLSKDVLAAVTLMLSLLIAFTAVAVWEAYSKAEDSLEREAAIAGELSRDLAVMGSPEALATREALRSYLRMVVDLEWPSMALGKESVDTSHTFNQIFWRAGMIEAKTSRDEIILGEIWDRTNELNTVRRGRLDVLKSAVPSSLRAVLAIVILVSFFLFFMQPATRFNQFLLGAYALTIGLIIFFIIVMDRPFAGKECLSAEPFEHALQSMDRWDKERPSGGK